MELSLRNVENRPLDILERGQSLSDLERRMDCLLGEVFGGLFDGICGSGDRRGLCPRIDIKETSDAFQILAEMRA